MILPRLVRHRVISLKVFLLIAVLFGVLAGAFTAMSAQNPVFRPGIDIVQPKLLNGCPVATDAGCFYKLKDVLNSGGDFWTTPFLPFDPKTGQGDGYGEGANGPRAAQRHVFNDRVPDYPYLRLNGLDSQSCFECHNSIGSASIDARGTLMRKAPGTAGSAGSNSNAFINPLYPKPQTLFIRNPPTVFGSGYTQAVAEEMSIDLFVIRDQARAAAKKQPGKPFQQALSAKGVNFGTLTTTFIPNSKARVVINTPSCKPGNDANCACKAGIDSPLSIGGQNGFTDDLTKLEGVSCDLVVRPFQWKGVASSLRHFVRDALDFHFSMQAFEKVAYCDCDRDGKGNQQTGPEVTIGQVTAMTSFVSMTRPPVQEPLSESAKLGEKIFFGKQPGLYQNMCANCHMGPMKLYTQYVLIESPTNPNDEKAPPINPDNPSTWPISAASCRNGVPSSPSVCPSESSYSASNINTVISTKNHGSLITPTASSQQLPIVRRYKANLQNLQEENLLQNSIQSPEGEATILRKLRAPFTANKTVSPAAEVNAGIVGQDYVIPLNPAESAVTDFQLPRLPGNPDNSVDVPLFSDLKRHNMGKSLSDPLPPLPAQGTDVANIINVPQEFLTRPLWGVADTGPWLHDGRATSLRQAILFHGDSATGGGSEAAPVIDAFEKLSGQQQQAIVDFLLTLQLPTPGNH
jgi:di-heme oxidoreductase (putative peroxidase)